MGKSWFWRRKYLIEPRIQLSITIYILSFILITSIFMYVSIWLSLNASQNQSERLSQGCLLLIKNNYSDIRSLLNTVFISNSVFAIIFAVVGGILVSHRIVGPIYRLRNVMTQLKANESPDTTQLRKNDNFQDLIPLLRELLNSLADETNEKNKK